MKIAAGASEDSLWEAPAFVAFATANAASYFAFQMLSVALGWQIYALSGRALDLGLIGLVQLIPSLVLALPAGHLADQFSRRKVVLGAQVLQCLATALLAVLIFAHQIAEPGILAIIFVVGIARALEFPALQAMLPALVPAKLLPRALAANSSAGTFATIAGPACGGLLYLAGPAAVYAASAALMLISLLFLARIAYVQAPIVREPASLKLLFAGVRFIKDRPDILAVISLDLFAVLLGGATALLPIFASDILHTGPWGLGVLRAAPAAGALVMSIGLSRYELNKRVGLTLYAAVAGFGLATIVFALSTNLWLSLTALFLLGAFDMVSMVIRGALVQLETPDEMRGRVSAVNAVFIDTSSQLGELESGLLAAAVGAMRATLIGGIGTLIVVAAWMIIFPKLRKRERLQE